MSNSVSDENPFGSKTGSLKKVKNSQQALFNLAMTVLAGAALTISLLPLFAVLSYVTVQGFNRLNLDLFTKLPPAPGLSGGGIANAIVGTLMTVGIASLMANQFAEASGLQVAALMYTGLILFILTLIVNILAEWIVSRVRAKYN